MDLATLCGLQIAFFGQILDQPKLTMHVGVGCPADKPFLLTTFFVRRDKGVSGRSPFPGQGKGLSRYYPRVSGWSAPETADTLTDAHGVRAERVRELERARAALRTDRGQ